MELWTSAHAKTFLPTLAVMIILCILLRKMLIERNLKIRMIPLQVIAVLLLVMKIAKQAVSFHRGYDLCNRRVLVHRLFPKRSADGIHAAGNGVKIKARY